MLATGAEDGKSDTGPQQEMTLGELLRDGLFIDGDWVETKDQDPDGDVRLIQLADLGDGVFRDPRGLSV